MAQNRISEGQALRGPIQPFLSRRSLGEDGSLQPFPEPLSPVTCLPGRLPRRNEVKTGAQRRLVTRLSSSDALGAF